MTEDQRKELAALAEDYEVKRRRFKSLKTDTIEEAVECHIAEAESSEAFSRLHNAKMKFYGSE